MVVSFRDPTPGTSTDASVSALAASLSLGAASESLRRSTGSDPGKGSVFMSDANVRRLVGTLGRMRGAALKLGQFMSIQGELSLRGFGG
jgi:predicted unusual protein kinase regulating ubiquinone biosynthesis (AarF/ABC1/UbiB family)